MEQAKALFIKKKRFNVTIKKINTKMINYDYITKEKKTQKKKMQLTMILIT